MSAPIHAAATTQDGLLEGSSLATGAYEELYRRSVDSPEAFWKEQSQRIHWHKIPEIILDSQPPFQRWFVGGETNLCYNAVDRHLESRADQLAVAADRKLTQ